jgi:hypothetical protein
MHDLLPVLLYCTAAIAATTTFALLFRPTQSRSGRGARADVAPRPKPTARGSDR